MSRGVEARGSPGPLASRAPSVLFRGVAEVMRMRAMPVSGADDGGPGAGQEYGRWRLAVWQV